MLMPDAIAEQHDMFLQRYRDTGIKNVIDSKRRSYAKLANGKRIMVELSVREVNAADIRSDSGTKRLFVGYLHDVTEDQKMLQANLLDRAISDACVIPMRQDDDARTSCCTPRRLSPPVRRHTREACD